MGDPVNGDTEYVRANAQWRVGIASLRRLRNLVDGDEKDEQFKRAAAKAVTACLAVVLILVLVTVLLYPAAIPNLFRSLS